MPEQTDKELLDRAEALTGIVRAAWITLIIGCLYAWLTLAALRDIDFFLAEKTLTLPIVGTGISTKGFFVFAPMLLFSASLYFELMLFRLWECYGRLRKKSERTDKTVNGLPVEELVYPWFLTVLIPQDHHEFDYIAKTIAVIFCWGFAPITILAVSYRYLRAHDLPLTTYHCVLIAIALVAAVEFRRHCLRAYDGDRPDDLRAIAVFSMAFVCICLFLTADWLISNPSPFPHYFRILSPHAQLHRAELSRKPPGWDELRWKEINDRITQLSKCLDTPSDEACRALRDRSTQGARELKSVEMEREWRRQMIVGAELGHIPPPEAPASQETQTSSAEHFFNPPSESPESQNSQDISKVCKKTADLVAAARHLRFALLREAYLVNANLHCADLRRADLREAMLEGADLRVAQMQRADLTAAQMQGADLRWAMLEGANLTEAQMQGAVLSEAQMQRADLTKAQMQGADLRWVMLEGANLKEAQMQGADLTEAQMQGAVLTSAEMRGSVLSEAQMQRAELGGAMLEGANLRLAQMQGANLTQARMQGANLTLAQMQGAELGVAMLEGAVLLWAHLEGADLQTAELQGAAIWAAEFDQLTDLTNANLTGASLRNADLSATNVTEDQLERAFGDGSVKRPKGVSRPPHWPKKPIEGAASFYNYWQGWRVACGWPEEAPGPALAWLKEDYVPVAWDKAEQGDPHCPPGSPVGNTVKAQP